MMRVGAEWRVAKHLALGAQINVFSVRLKKPEGLELEKNELLRHRAFRSARRFALLFLK